MIKTRTTLLALGITILFSWIVLPFIIPPFRAYTFLELTEVLFWQIIGLVSWPLVLPVSFFNLLLQGSFRDLVNIFILLIYPGMILLLVRVLFFKHYHRWELYLLHALLIFSFGLIWYRVLNGYVFMSG
jgi:hypothetical protein